MQQSLTHKKTEEEFQHFTTAQIKDKKKQQNIRQKNTSTKEETQQDCRVGEKKV